MKNQRIFELLQGLIRNHSSIHTFLNLIRTSYKVESTNVNAKVYAIKLDGNMRPCIKDLAEYLSEKIIDYSIPRNQISDAVSEFEKTGSTHKIVKLGKKAKNLFSSLEKSGEGGEILLYILIEQALKAPQLICKMPLKTHSEIHYHGTDGIHVDYKNDKLILYWGESKLYKSIHAAITNCFDSVSGFFIDQGGSNARQTRDLELVTEQLKSLDSEQLEDALIKYFDKDCSESNFLEYRAACLIGFDFDSYPNAPNIQNAVNTINKAIKIKLPNWKQKIAKEINKYDNLNSFIIHVFLIPFPSVQEFRDAFLSEIGIKSINKVKL